MIKQTNILYLLILFFILLVLISAFIIEYALGHEPCKLCLYQRIPYIFSLILILVILFLKKYEKNILLILSLIFFSSTILAFYHFGIEQGFFSETLVCETKNAANSLSKEDILKQLKQNNISCKEVNFRIFGLSLASINTFFSLVLSAIFLKLFNNYEKN